MRKSISMVLLQTLFWGTLVIGAGTVVVKGVHALSQTLTSVLAGEVKK